MESIKRLKNDFSPISFHHIPRVYNKEAYTLSKIDLGPMDGFLSFHVFNKGKLCRAGRLSLFNSKLWPGKGLDLLSDCEVFYSLFILLGD